MQRRDLLERIGKASIATMGVAGTASASHGVDLDREVDVTDVSGKASLESILPAEALGAVPAAVDVSDVQLTVAEDADTITPSGCCCCECTAWCVDQCEQACCLCPS